MPPAAGAEEPKGTITLSISARAQSLISFLSDELLYMLAVTINSAMYMYIQSISYIWILMFWRGTLEMRFCEI